MKSLPWSEMPLNVSLSKCQSHLRTLFKVSMSSSPANGERPLSLKCDNDMKLFHNSIDLVEPYVDMTGNFIIKLSYVLCDTYTEFPYFHN